jgi:hypothetical protein
MNNQLADIINRLNAIKNHPTTDSWEQEQIDAALDRLQSVKIGKELPAVPSSEPSYAEAMKQILEPISW